MPEKTMLDVTATTSTHLSGKEVAAAMEALIAEGHTLGSLTQRQVWKKLGNRGSLETVSKWFKRFHESKDSPNGAGAMSDGKTDDSPGGETPSGSGTSGSEGGSPAGTANAGAKHATEGEGGTRESRTEPEDPNAFPPPLEYPPVDGAVLALMQNNYVRDVASLKESHHRECELMRQLTEDRVARARAEVRAEVITSLDSRKRFAFFGAMGLCVVVGGITAWSGFIVGRAEGGKESLKVISGWVESERARAPDALVPPVTATPVPPISAPEPAPNAETAIPPTPAAGGAGQPAEKPSGPTAPIEEKQPTPPADPINSTP